MYYADTTLEKLYTFGRFLYKEIPRDASESRVEFNDEFALQYYRLDKSDEGTIKLGSEGGGVSSPTDTVTGSKEDEEVELCTIDEKINEELGTDFTEADQLFLDKVKEDALEDDHPRGSAQVTGLR